MLSREKILERRPRRTKVVPVPEWGGDVIVQAMTPSEAALFEMRMLNRDGEPIPHLVKTQNERMCIETIVDEHGQRVLSDADLPTLSKGDSAAVRRVADAARELAGMDPAKSRRRIEDLAGNFEEPNGPAGSSGTSRSRPGDSTGTSTSTSSAPSESNS